MKYKDTLFVNKSLKCFKSIFAKKTQFKILLTWQKNIIFYSNQEHLALRMLLEK